MENVRITLRVIEGTPESKVMALYGSIETVMVYVVVVPDYCKA